METIKFDTLGITNDEVYHYIDFNGVQIGVLDHLPIQEQYNIVNITLQKADENGVFHPIKRDMYFELNLVYAYTNLEFSEDDRANEPELYDKLRASGLLAAIKQALPQEEYDELNGWLYAAEVELSTRRNTMAGAITDLIDNLTPNAEQAAEIIKNFDPAQFQQVLDFARAANGGREIPTGQAATILAPKA